MPLTKKTFRKGDLRYIDKEGKEYGISKRELGIMASGGDKKARNALKRTKNHTFIYPDKILREKKSKGGVMEPYHGSMISGTVDGKNLSNPSYRKYYGSLLRGMK